MTLNEKILKAESCSSYALGACGRNGYPPFDCERCSCYSKRKNSEANNQSANKNHIKGD